MKVYTLGEVMDEAAQTFRIFGGGRTDMRKTGMGPLDRIIGGMFPGAVGIVAADTGVGKSSLLLSACLNVDYTVGIISAEDMADVLGSRALAAASGVDSLKMRRPKQHLAAQDLATIKEGRDRLRMAADIRTVFPPRKTVEALREAAKALTEEGCRFLWLDYVQKFRGTGNDRRNEVGAVFTAFQEECQAAGVPGMALSQFKRRDQTREPRLSDMKESGDLENECRLAVVAWPSQDDPRLVNCKIAKSTYGGGGVRFQYRRDPSGTLREVTYDDVEW